MGQPVRCLERHAHCGKRPDESEQRPSPRPFERAERERRVAAGDEQEDRALVELAEELLRSGLGDGVVERRSCIDEQHRGREHGRGRDVECRAVAGGGHDEDRDRSGSEQSHPVAYAVGDFLAARLDAFVVALHAPTVAWAVPSDRTVAAMLQADVTL